MVLPEAMGESSPRQSSLDGAAGSRKSSNLLHEDNRNAVAANTTGPSLSPSPARPVTGDEPDGVSLTSTGEGATVERPLGFRKALTTLWPRRKSPQPNAAQLDEVSRGPLGLRLLHEASEPMVEVIFVHGLRGGSTKTWRKGEDPGLFWPKAFLPADPDFQNASIYSFGYDSDWGSAKRSILDVHDFGSSLLEAMRTSPNLRSRPKTPIVLIGHSMGGLVVKKSYILARESKSDPDFAKRIQCVFFLATPHRGSDYAAMLNNVLKVSGFLSPKQYLADLTASSSSLQWINRDFCKYADDLHVFSFFETLEMSLGPTSALIVEKTSAVLGPDCKTERVQYINANHREICKFDGPDDPNYLIIRDSLSTALDLLLKKPVVASTVSDKSQLATLQTYLGMKGRGEAHHPKVEGSCRWIEHREDFQNWIAGGGSSPGFYVMTAQPGAGKTVLAAHVISHLRSRGLSCAHHFFQHGNYQEQSLSRLLRSIAYQMASSNAVFRDPLLKLHEEGSTFSMDDTRAIWANVFENGLFQTSCPSPQYWVIDALDECSNYRGLFTFLKGTSPSFALNVLITSRVLPDLRRLLKSLAPDLTPLEIPQADTMKDISSYIQSRADALPVSTDEERDELSAKIQSKSGACFLWVRLVLDELEQVYGFESVMEILDGIPEGMIPYYQRATGMIRRKRGTERRIAKAILGLVIAAARPLGTAELAQALGLESADLRLRQDVRTAVEGLCSYLVQVGADGSVQVVHLTAREFLISEDASEFRVVASDAQERIALTCLALLSAPELRPPAHPGLLPQWRLPSPSFLDYAATYFSHHVFSTSSEARELLLAIYTFLTTNVQSWIEYACQKDDLQCLLKASADLRGYLDRAVEYEPPMAMEIKTVGDWSTDLARLVTAFGNVLVHSPSSIYFQIPPLTPTTSAIYLQFGKRPGGMSLTGYDNSSWDECLASVRLDVRGDALACGRDSIAVASYPGIVLYHSQSFQKQIVFDHGFWINRLQFDRSGRLLLSSDGERLAVWDQERKFRWEHTLRENFKFLEFSEKEVIGFSESGHLFKWDADDGTLLVHDIYEFPTSGSCPNQERPPFNFVSLAAISPRMDVLAIYYSSHGLCLWLTESKHFVGWAAGKAVLSPIKIMFNPRPEVNLLLVAYSDSKLDLYDSYSGTFVRSAIGAHAHPGILVGTTISPDGRTVATVNYHRLLTIWDFETLSVLQYIRPRQGLDGTLKFSFDSSKLIELSGMAMKVWSPRALQRRPHTQDIELSCRDEPEESSTQEVRAICAHPSRPVIVAGNIGGQVIAYSSLTGEKLGLICHTGSSYPISALALSAESLVASGDLGGNVAIHDLDTALSTSIKSRSVTLRDDKRGPVTELHFMPGASLLLVARTTTHSMFFLDGTCSGEFEDYHGWYQNSRWLCRGNSKREGRLFRIDDLVLRQFDIQKFPERVGRGDIHLDVIQGDLPMGWVIEGANIYYNILALNIGIGTPGFTSRCWPLLFDLRDAQENDAGELHLSKLPLVPRLRTKIGRMIVPRPDGASRDQLLFLSYDNWVAGVSLGKQDTETYSEYFPVPNEFVRYDERDEVFPVRTIDDDIVFPLHGKLAIFRNGLKFPNARKL